jgi:hypothetical protein
MSTHTERRSVHSEDAEGPQHESQVITRTLRALARPGECPGE